MLRSLFSQKKAMVDPKMRRTGTTYPYLYCTTRGLKTQKERKQLMALVLKISRRETLFIQTHAIFFLAFALSTLRREKQLVNSSEAARYPTGYNH